MQRRLFAGDCLGFRSAGVRRIAAVVSLGAHPLRTGCSNTTARSALRGCAFGALVVDRYFGRRSFDLRLRTSTGDDGFHPDLRRFVRGLAACLIGLRYRSLATLTTSIPVLLALAALATRAALTTLGALCSGLATFAAVLPFAHFTTLTIVATFAVVATIAIFTAFAVVALLASIAIVPILLRLGLGLPIVLIVFTIAAHLGLIIVVVTVVVAVAAEVALVALEAFLHLRLRRRNHAVVMLGMLEIVFSHHVVANALRVAGQRRVLLGNVLRRTANLHIWAGAVIGTRERVAPFAVVIIAAVIAAATAAATIVAAASALLLLS
ncbi:membrane hypothetical protein [Rhizobium sp. EC-SD404]|nr:membrane hypothetical protein [Rhizobium sp. EC-SD404]